MPKSHPSNGQQSYGGGPFAGLFQNFGNGQQPQGPGSAPVPEGNMQAPSGPGSAPVPEGNMQAPEDRMRQQAMAMRQGAPAQGSSEHWKNMTVGGIPMVQRSTDVQNGKTLLIPGKNPGDPAQSRDPHKYFPRKKAQVAAERHFEQKADNKLARQQSNIKNTDTMMSKAARNTANKALKNRMGADKWKTLSPEQRMAKRLQYQDHHEKKFTDEKMGAWVDNYRGADFGDISPRERSDRSIAVAKGEY